ncbi:hypothetical protein BDV25DRAFT_158999 [Aspergillus avenaceus]|uniref:Secreted protein CSS2 C-terminal domain-containing protein n=1 Tax=Aspergillus avenaceus TaxID=36643 RepID=A0A5N6TP70_ASPAV|nr:hypothetical protein BDV25DRAFT_158999 [Aspergillus avenaceus]
MLFTRNALITVLCTLPLSWASAPVSDKPSAESQENEAIFDNSYSAYISQIPMAKFQDTLSIMTSSYYTATEYILNMTNTLSTSIKDWSNTVPVLTDCKSLSGTHENLKWVYYAIEPHCGIEERTSIVKHAIDHYQKSPEQSFESCSTQCLRFDEGGKLDGWIKVGLSDGFNQAARCDSVGCVSGV